MNKAKKGLLTAGSIVSIVSSSVAILSSFVFLLLGFVFNETFIKNTYMSDPLTYTYVEEADGSYYFTQEDIYGNVIITHEEDIEMASNIALVVCSVCAVSMLATGVPKLILAIVILAKKGRDVYAKGATITLLVFSCLCGNITEFVLYLIAICLKTKADQPIEMDQETQIAA